MALLLLLVLEQAGIDNLTGYTDPTYIPTLVGRLWYTALRWNWQTRN